MARIKRIRVALTGLPGLPGVSTFYCLDPVAIITPLRAYWSGMATFMPINTSIQIEPAGDEIEATDGKLVGSWVAPSTLPLSGGGSGTYAAPVGLATSWFTSVIADGSRIAGRTFVVPCGTTVFDLTGNINADSLTLARGVSLNLVNDAANNLVIWHRPSLGRPATPTSPARPAHVGSFAFVTSSTVKDVAVVLRSRRD